MPGHAFRHWLPGQPDKTRITGRIRGQGFVENGGIGGRGYADKSGRVSRTGLLGHASKPPKTGFLRGLCVISRRTRRAVEIQFLNRFFQRQHSRVGVSLGGLLRIRPVCGCAPSAFIRFRRDKSARFPCGIWITDVRMGERDVPVALSGVAPDEAIPFATEI